MPDIFLTLVQLENLFASLTLQMLGYDPADYADADHPPASMPVRVAWPPLGAPAWKRTEDVVFLRVGEDDDDINKPHDVVYQPQDADNAEQQTGQTRVVRVHWVCYGPNSYDNAVKIRRLLFADQYRAPLTDNKIYLIPAVRSPVRMPEPYGAQWWERADISAQFNELLQFNVAVPYLKSAEINVTDNNGQTTSADVPAQN